MIVSTKANIFNIHCQNQRYFLFQSKLELNQLKTHDNRKNFHDKTIIACILRVIVVFCVILLPQSFPIAADSVLLAVIL